MDWIEQLFGVAPDDGDGSIEMMVLVTLVVAAAVLFVSCYGPARRALQRRLGWTAATPSGAKRP